MRVLLVKLSSMGDIIHTLPAVTDAAQAIPGIKFTWLVEAGFQEIAAWHPAVEKVIPIEMRRGNKQQVFNTIKQLRSQKFDVILDAQGLVKSAVLARLARGKIRVGYDRESSREPLASIIYNRTAKVAKQLHAVDRTRRLFADTLGYLLTHTTANYGINWQDIIGQHIVGQHIVGQHIVGQNIVTPQHVAKPYLMFLHGTTWDTKHWPDIYWLQLADLVATQGYAVQVTWATAEQKQRAQRLQAYAQNVTMLPHLSINQAAAVLQNASGVVAVDTGFAHLAAAMNKPIVAIFGATDVRKCGTVSETSINLTSEFACAPCSRRSCNYTGDRELNPPCLQEITPGLVWNNLAKVLQQT